MFDKCACIGIPKCFENSAIGPGIILAVIIAFSGFHSYSQDSSESALVTEIRSPATPDTSKILAMTELAYKYWTTRADSTLLLSIQAIEQSRKIGFTKGLGRAYFALGIYHNNLGESTLSLAYYDSALTSSTKANDKLGIGRTYNGLGQLYVNFGDYQKALNYHFQGLVIKDALGDIDGVGNSYNNIGNIYFHLGNNVKALDYCVRGLAIRKERKDKQGIAASENNIALIYENMGDTEKAIEFFMRALGSFKDAGILRGITYACNDIAKLYLRENQFAKAYQFLMEGRAVAEDMKSNERLADFGVSFSVYYNAIGKYDLARKEAQHALYLAQESGFPEYARAAYREMAKASFSANQYKDAYAFELKYNELTDSLQNEISMERALQEEFDFREEKNRIEQEKKDLIYQNNAERQKLLLYIIVGILTGVIIVAFALFRNSRDRKKTNELLAAQKDELGRKNEVIGEQNRLLQQAKIDLELKVEERTGDLQIANRELVNKNVALEQFSFITAHNLRGPVARLKGLGSLYNFTNLSEPFNAEIMLKMIQSASELDEVIRDITSILQIRTEIDKALVRLNPRELMNKVIFQLRLSIDDRNIIIKNELEPEIIVDGNLAYVQSVFYNVISNSVKYSKTTGTPEIKITSHRGENETSIKIVDNGSGFDSAANASKLFRPFTRFATHSDGKGLGLYLIKIQMESMRGQVHIESKINKGTTVILMFPATS